MSLTVWTCWSCRLPCSTRSTVWHCAVELLGTVAVLGEWSIVLAMHCSRTVAACLHALQALIVLMSGALETCTPALGTCVPSCTGRPARLFLCLRPAAHREPWDTWQRQSSPQSGGEVHSHMTRGSTGAHLSWEVRFEAIVHVAAPEPISVGRRDLEP
jgi:hypothetical protein